MKKVAIIGAGNIAKSITKALILSGYDPNLITIVGRETTDFSKVENFGINLSREIKDIFDAEVIMLTVKPSSAGSVLKQIHQEGKNIEGYSSFNRGRKWTFISFVSGLTIDLITQYTFFRDNYAICMVNTNIAYGDGVLLYTPSHEDVDSMIKNLFSAAGVLLNVKAKEIIKLITFLGSMNAIHAKVLWNIYKKTKSEKSFWIFLEDELLGLPSMSEDIHQEIDLYLLNYGKVYKKFRVDYSKEIFLSTINTLVKRKISTLEQLEQFISEVATKNGCTEKGINLIGNDFSFNALIEVIKPIFEASKTFSKIIRESLEENNNIEIVLNQLPDSTSWKRYKKQ